jgi:hypothetical protein
LLAQIRSAGIGRFFSRIFGVPDLASRSTRDRPKRSVEPDVSFKELIEVVVESGVPSDLLDQFEHHTGAEPVELSD